MTELVVFTLVLVVTFILIKLCQWVVKFLDQLFENTEEEE